MPEQFYTERVLLSSDGCLSSSIPPRNTRFGFALQLLLQSLTPPTLLSCWEKSGRGGTGDETVKLLDGTQGVQVPPGHSRADRPEASVAIHRATGGCEAYTARKQAVKIQLRKLGW